jgi:HD-like signal output (HDOD) protein
MDARIEKIKQSARLITLPEIYFKLRELLDGGDYNMAEVALLVGRDPGMAARFLRLVNSALYRRAAKIETIGHAVSMLGTQQVHDVVLCASVAGTFAGVSAGVMNMRHFWQRSVYVAETARQLSRHWPELESERLFLIGLLHDIGHLFIYLAFPDEAQEVIAASDHEKRPLFRVERERFGFDYALVGGLMLKLWGLPKSLRIPIAHHPEPSQATDYELETVILHIATRLVQADLEKGDGGEIGVDMAPATLQRTGLTQGQCLEARKAAAAQCGTIAASLFGRTAHQS